MRQFSSDGRLRAKEASVAVKEEEEKERKKIERGLLT
jgi:hypothetical protein